ncbi:hypothetical protein [Brevibacterium spongiae]|uniref:Uncharacterized protein n=1 Tax=Brevibacterium spongiae TaxID=2909672 RepID=A0ABY5SNQ6_9MICO|nr:hypothetical protein [Brevibacterium spongiae]UVI34704.1 hypothetical protein L1F31_11225 [Brevibacterium spongiae]
MIGAPLEGSKTGCGSVLRWPVLTMLVEGVEVVTKTTTRLACMPAVSAKAVVIGRLLVIAGIAAITHRGVAASVHDRFAIAGAASVARRGRSAIVDIGFLAANVADRAFAGAIGQRCATAIIADRSFSRTVRQRCPTAIIADRCIAVELIALRTTLIAKRLALIVQATVVGRWDLPIGTVVLVAMDALCVWLRTVVDWAAISCVDLLAAIDLITGVDLVAVMSFGTSSGCGCTEVPVRTTSIAVSIRSVRIKLVGALQPTIVFESFLAHAFFALRSLRVELFGLGGLTIGIRGASVSFSFRALCLGPLLLDFGLPGANIVL